MKHSIGYLLVGVVLVLQAAGCALISTPVTTSGYLGEIVPHDKVQATESELSVAVLGNTNVLISDGEHAVLMDGFFNRSGLLGSLLGRRQNLQNYYEEVKAGLDQAHIQASVDAVVVSHSHFDHAMDAPVVSAIMGADLIGSSDTKLISDGYKDFLQATAAAKKYRFCEVSDYGGSWENKFFHIELFPSEHGPAELWLQDTLFRGRINKSVAPMSSAFAYKTGPVYTILITHKKTCKRFLIHPSAGKPGFKEQPKADVVFLGIGSLGRQSLEAKNAYFDQLVENTHAKIVIPIHWENFSRSTNEPAKPRRNIFDRLDKAKEFLNARIALNDNVVIRWLKSQDRLVFSSAWLRKGECYSD